MARLANVGTRRAGGLIGLTVLIGLTHHQVTWHRPPSDLPSDLWGVLGGYRG